MRLVVLGFGLGFVVELLLGLRFFSVCVLGFKLYGRSGLAEPALKYVSLPSLFVVLSVLAMSLEIKMAVLPSIFPLWLLVVISGSVACVLVELLVMCLVLQRLGLM